MIRVSLLASVAALFQLFDMDGLFAQGSNRAGTVHPIKLAINPAIKNDPAVFVNQLANGVVYYIKEISQLKSGPDGEAVAGAVRQFHATLAINSSDSARFGDSYFRQFTFQSQYPLDSNNQIVAFKHLRDSLDSFLAKATPGAKTCVAVTSAGMYSKSDIETAFNKEFHSATGLMTNCLSEKKYYLDRIAADNRRNDTLDDISVRYVALCPSGEKLDYGVLLQYSSPERLKYDPAYRFVWDQLNSIFLNMLGQRVGELRSRSDSVIRKTISEYQAYPFMFGNSVTRSGVSYLNVSFDVQHTADTALKLLANELGQILARGFTDEEIVLWREMLLAKHKPVNSFPLYYSQDLTSQYTINFFYGDVYSDKERRDEWISEIALNLNQNTLNTFIRFWLKDSKPTSIWLASSDRENFKLIPSSPDKPDVDLKPETIKYFRDVYTNKLRNPTLAAKLESNFKIADLDYIDGMDFEERLQIDIDKAKKAGLTPVIEFGAIWCLPCRLIDVSLKHPAMQDAFKGIYLIRVDIDVWEEQLKDAAFPIKSLPAFFATGINGKPTGAVKYGAEVDMDQLNILLGKLNDNFAVSAAPGFKEFFEKCKKEFLSSR